MGMMDRGKEGSIDTDPKSLGQVELLLFPPRGNALVSDFYNDGMNFSFHDA